MLLVVEQLLYASDAQPLPSRINPVLRRSRCSGEAPCITHKLCVVGQVRSGLAHHGARAHHWLVLNLLFR